MKTTDDDDDDDDANKQTNKQTGEPESSSERLARGQRIERGPQAHRRDWPRTVAARRKWRLYRQNSGLQG